MVKKIVGAKNPVLREKALPVIKLDKKVLGLVRDLKDTLAIQKDPEGVGLAAPQIGKSLRIFVMSYKKIFRVVINPEIKKVGEELSPGKKEGEKEILEGCLSLPNYYSPLRRSREVTVRYLNEEGGEVTETFKGFNAQIVLHEIDHLNGILFVDRLLEQSKPLYKLNGKDWEEVEL